MLMFCLRAGVCAAAGDEGMPPSPGETQDDPSGELERVDDERFALSGYVSLRALHDLLGHGNTESQGSVVAVVKGKLDLEDSTLAMQLRPEFVRSSQSGDRVARVRVDELNWEMEISTSAFLFAGRKRIVNGVALGRNPSDFFNLDKPEDRTLADEDRRAEKKGRPGRLVVLRPQIQPARRRCVGGGWGPPGQGVPAADRKTRSLDDRLFHHRLLRRQPGLGSESLDGHRRQDDRLRRDRRSQGSRSTETSSGCAERIGGDDRGSPELVS